MALASKQWVKSLLTKAKEQGKLGGEEIYSEDEIVIGKWIDGKPLYRKTYITDAITLYNGGQVKNTDLGDFLKDLDVMTKIHGTINREDGWQIEINSYQYTSGFRYVAYNKSTHMMYTAGMENVIANVYIHFEYTKTTD